MAAIRWHLRHNLSSRNAEEPLVEPGVQVDHATILGWIRSWWAKVTEPPPARRIVIANRKARPRHRRVNLPRSAKQLRRRRQGYITLRSVSEIDEGQGQYAA
jgi:hypothetical protein